MEILTDPGMIAVLALRILGPLLIFRWPLAGALLSQLVFDMFDVVIWDAAGTLSRIDYTAWEKPLDLYQLTIQLIVCCRWMQPIPRRWAQVLFGWRLVGFVLYEITRERVFFLIFPNLFFVFYVFYLLCLKWKKAHWFDRQRTVWIILALLLFIIKLPQEYLLHYARVEPWTFLKQWFGG